MRIHSVLARAYPDWPGQVEDWEQMERFWQQSVSHYLRVDSEDHNFILTEPPMNPPENREITAEIMWVLMHVPISVALLVFKGIYSLVSKHYGSFLKWWYGNALSAELKKVPQLLATDDLGRWE